MGNGTEGGTEGESRRERKWTGNSERGGRWELGGKRGLEEKKQPLVGNAAE